MTNALRDDRFIRVEGRFQAVTDDDKREPADDVEQIIVQLQRDATYGTFADLPQALKNQMTGDEATFARTVDVQREGDSNVFKFSFELSEALFPYKYGGLQHLFGVLAGDLFSLTLEGFKISSLSVDDVRYPELTDAITSKGKLDRINRIRQVFGLEENEPLLAFSIKPRVGLTSQALRDIVMSVLGSGFHIAEVDTRSVLRDESELRAAVALAHDAAQKFSARRIGRFSANLTAPAHLAMKYAEQIGANVPTPFVLKVDGGLDGLSAMQAIRESAVTDDAFITCYPLLRDAFAMSSTPRVPRDVFNMALVASGADILYPGGRPYLPGTTARQLGAGDSDAILRGIRIYRDIVAKRAFMPTVAGGIHAGQLHAYYELLGPDVAYFLGGAIALHKKDPAAGAELCRRVIDHAMALRKKAGTAVTEDLPPKLQLEIEASTGGALSTPYVSPQTLIGKIGRPRLWYQESTAT